MDFSPKSFTVRYSGRTNVLFSETVVFQAFDPLNKPAQTPLGFKCRAIWDTGATSTGISDKVVSACGLKPIGIVPVRTAGGERREEVFLVNIMLRNNVGIPNLRVIKADIHDADVLIGMDIISLGDFAITHRNDETAFTFRIPSIAHIDFVAESHQAQKPIRHDEAIPSRNSLCPCGSGKKYKRCCGR